MSIAQFDKLNWKVSHSDIDGCNQKPAKKPKKVHEGDISTIEKIHSIKENHIYYGFNLAFSA